MGLISLMLVLGTAAAQSVVPPGTVATGSDLKKALADAPAGPMTVARIETTDTTRVNLIHRTVPQNAIIHPTGWEVHHITDGTGTVVTGGRVVRSTGAAGERVAKIEDGESRVVTVGDVVIIPAGTPHWYSDIDGSVTYLEIRYDPGID
jgi:mannose-6-phosphate isomerase-like protein (cupin superfamily)